MSRSHTPRAHERRSVAVPARLRLGFGDSVVGVVSNLSENGCCIRAVANTFKAGCRMMIHLDGVDLIEGTVIWSRDEQVGLRFDAMLSSDVVDRLARANQPTGCTVTEALSWPMG